MSQEESSATRSLRRSRPAFNRGRQPTVAQLARLGIRVRDFAYESTLPPVRTVYSQPRQIQPGVARQLHREDTEPVEESQQSQSQRGALALVRTVTEPALDNAAGPLITRELGGFLDEAMDQIVSFQPSRRLHPETAEDSRVIQHVVTSQETGVPVPTPTVTPNGSLQWKELSERNTTPLQMHPNHLHPSISGFSSPLTPLPSSPSSSNRSPSMASLDKPSPKRQKIAIDNNSRPGMKRYYLRKRPPTAKHIPPSKHFHPASPLSRTVSVRSDHLRSSPSSSRPLHQLGGTGC